MEKLVRVVKDSIGNPFQVLPDRIGVPNKLGWLAFLTDEELQKVEKLMEANNERNTTNQRRNPQINGPRNPLPR